MPSFQAKTYLEDKIKNFSLYQQAFAETTNFHLPSWLKNAEEKIAKNWHPHHPRKGPQLKYTSGIVPSIIDLCLVQQCNPPNVIWPAYGISSLNCSLTGYQWGDPHLCGYGQVIGIADWFDDPNIESDLGVFTSLASLPSCTMSNGCFEKIEESVNGQPPLQPVPGTPDDTSPEISLDVEWAHAVAPGAKILLVEAFNDTSVMDAVSFAEQQQGVHQVSMSFDTQEFPFETLIDNLFQVSGVSFFAASGDFGNQVNYPCVSPWVVCVGGTSLNFNSTGNFQNETAWSGSGGGISTVYPEPQYQINHGISSSNMRGVPDVSLSATNYPIVDSYGCTSPPCIFPIGGTSASTPVWAAIMAIANGERSSPLSSVSFGTNSALYNAASGNVYSTNYRDIASGSNGNCGTVCNAGPGYDFVTGLGTPLANRLVPYLNPMQSVPLSNTLPFTDNVSLNTVKSLPDILSFTDNVQTLKTLSSPCVPPSSGDWTISQNCAISSSFTAPTNVIVQPAATLTIPNGLKLNIDFTHYHLLVKSGGRVLIKGGGAIN